MSHAPDAMPDEYWMLLRCVPCQSLFRVSSGEAGLAANCPQCGVLLALPKEWRRGVQPASPILAASAASAPKAMPPPAASSGPRKVQAVPVRAEGPRNLAAKVAGQEFAPLREPGGSFAIPPSRAKGEYQVPDFIVPNTNAVKAPLHDEGEGPRLQHRDRIATTNDARFAPDPDAPGISRPVPDAGGRRRHRSLVGWDEDSQEMNAVPSSPFRRFLRIAGVAALTLLVGTLLFLVVRDSGGPRKSFEGPVMEKSTSPLPAETGESRELTAKFENEVIPLARAFLDAPTMRERLALVRDPERVRPLMEKYHRENGTSGPIPYRQIGEATDVRRAGPFFLLPVTLDDYSERRLAIEEVGEKLLADWESFVIYSDTTFRRFVQERPQEPKTFRVEIASADYFNYGFTEDEYFCFRSLEPGTGDILYGYARRDAPATDPGPRLDAFLRTRPKGTTYVIVRLAFPPEAKVPNQVLIEDFVQKGWVIRNDDEDSSDPATWEQTDDAGILPTP